MNRFRRSSTTFDILPDEIQGFIKGKGIKKTIKDKIAFFRENEVSEDDFEYILNALTYKFLPESTDVIKYGEYGDKFYIILSGTVGVLIPDTTHQPENEEIKEEDTEELSEEKSEI